MFGLFTQPAQGSINLDHFAKNVQIIIVKAQLLAEERKHAQIQPLHVFSYALKDEAIIKTFQNLKLSHAEMVKSVETALSDMPSDLKEKDGGSYFSSDCEKLFSSLEKDSSSSDLVQIEKFFAALISRSCKTNNALWKASGIDIDAFINELSSVRKAGFNQLSNAALLKMEESIGKRVIGQKEAIHAVSRVVRRGKVGLNDAGKPIGSLLFLGPSGVGKTELAKGLTEFLNGDEKKLVRFDMSEFGEKHMAQRLIGSPPGYQDSSNGGQLTEAVKRDPNAVILFDEIEKAHPDVFNMLLQVLDDGRLTDGRGQTSDFSNTIIIMTSNLGSRKIIDSADNLSQGEEQKEILKAMLHAEMMKFLRPELINRIDDIIIFTPLNKLEISQIVDIQLRQVEKLLAKKEMKISFDQETRDAIGQIGFDPLMGGRPIKRVILKYVRDPLAERILAGDYLAGSEVKVSYSNEHFHLN